MFPFLTRQQNYLIQRMMMASVLCLVMIAISVSGYCIHEQSQQKEWTKIVLAPAMAQTVFVVPEQRAVVYENPRNTIPAKPISIVEAKCRSPGYWQEANLTKQ